MKKRGLIIILAVVAIVVAGVVAFANPLSGISADTAHAQDLLHRTIPIERTDLSRVLSTSGVVRSTDTQYVFSTHNRPVREILVSVGDTVEAGDVLAILDMSNVENDIAQTELNLINAQRNVFEEERNNANSVTNAQTSVDSARISLQRQALNVANAERDLETAQSDIYEPFDSYMHDRAIADARTNLERRRADLDEIHNDFDDRNHLNTIAEAQITLERRLADLAEAEVQLNEEIQNGNQPFDATNFQNAITDAERNLDRRRADESTAQWNLQSAWNTFFSTPPEMQHQARSQIDTAEAQVENARRAVEDAELNLSRARDELTRARRNHNENAEDMRETAISAAERTFNNAQNAADDAQRALDRAISDLDRARSDAETTTSNRLTTAINNYNDAIRTYERAISDRSRAMEDSTTNNENRLNNAQRSLQDSQNQLQSAQNSLRSAQESLTQAATRPAASSTNVEIQELNLERLNSTLDEGFIIAPASGVITSINASVGAAASGVLFIIEDVDNLYVAANVREHTLGDLEVGQRAFVTTEITGNMEYGAELTFISPRSVSPAGSTNVEFEIHATMDESDSNVRIGMNAFINVILASGGEVYAVPISAVTAMERGGFISVLEEDGEVRNVPVRTGLRTSTHVEIISPDIYEGMMILERPGLLDMPNPTGMMQRMPGGMGGMMPPREAR